MGEPTDDSRSTAPPATGPAKKNQSAEITNVSMSGNPLPYSPSFNPTALPQNVRVNHTLLSVEQNSWQGPYPSPEAVERFEAVLPGSFGRILAMAENAQASELDLNQKAQTYLRDDIRRSHYFGLAISLTALIAATVCAIAGREIVAGLVVGIPVMAVARAFINNSNTK